MACPLFLPASPLTGLAAQAAPLGDLYGGECAAEAGSIPEDILRGCCNRGYARDSCARAAQSDTDAFRFLVKANRDGVIDIAWSSERNHFPVAVGTLALDANIIAAPAGIKDAGPLERQARACAAAYLRQIGN